jgi:hypothetical protein
MVRFRQKAPRNDEDTGAFEQEDGGGMREGSMGMATAACEKDGDGGGGMREGWGRRRASEQKTYPLFGI